MVRELDSGRIYLFDVTAAAEGGDARSADASSSGVRNGLRIGTESFTAANAVAVQGNGNRIIRTRRHELEPAADVMDQRVREHA